MTAYDDLDRTLDAWLGTGPAPVPPPEGLARILETSRGAPAAAVPRGRLREQWIIGPATADAFGLRSSSRWLRSSPWPSSVPSVWSAVGWWLRGHPRTPTSTSSSSAPDLSMPMAYPVLVPLLDGRVLVIGDDGDGGGTGTRALVYDPATGVSEPTGPIVSGDSLWAEAAVRLKDGRVLVIGNALRPRSSIRAPCDSRRPAPCSPRAPWPRSRSFPTDAC